MNYFICFKNGFALSVSTSHSYVLLSPEAPRSTLSARVTSHLQVALLDKTQAGPSLSCLPKEPIFVPLEVVMPPLSQQTLGMLATFSILLSISSSNNSKALDFSDLNPTSISTCLNIQETHGLLKLKMRFKCLHPPPMRVGRNSDNFLWTHLQCFSFYTLSPEGVTNQGSKTSALPSPF